MSRYKQPRFRWNRERREYEPAENEVTRSNYHCPRCDEYLDIHSARGVWCLWFECSHCWLAFIFHVEKRGRGKMFRTLVPGRKLLSQAQR